MANPYTGTVAVTNIITPKDRADTYPVVAAEHVKGGLRQVASRLDLDNIPQEHLIDGMLVLLQDTRELVIYSIAEKAFKNFSAGGGSVEISADLGNKLEKRPDGLFIDAITRDEIGNIDDLKTKISKIEGNAIEEKDDGIYVRSIDWTIDWETYLSFL